MYSCVSYSLASFHGRMVGDAGERWPKKKKFEVLVLYMLSVNMIVCEQNYNMVEGRVFK